MKASAFGTIGKLTISAFARSSILAANRGVFPGSGKNEGRENAFGEPGKKKPGQAVLHGIIAFIVIVVLCQIEKYS